MRMGDDPEELKICVINPNFYRSSGVTIAIKNLYAATNGLGIQQYFVDCGYGVTDGDKTWIRHQRSVSFPLMHINPLVAFWAVRDMDAWLRQTGIRILHVYHRRLAAILWATKALHGCQIIYTGNGVYPFAAWFWPVRPDAATAITESVADNMRSMTRIREVQVIGNPVVFPVSPDTLDDSGIYVDAVCVGRLDPGKGHGNLIRAWAKLRDQGHRAKLALVGEGKLEGALRRLVAEKGLSDLVEFRGFHSDVAAEFRRGRFAILLSKSEGQGIVVLEAAAAGRASLLTDVPGLKDCRPPNCTLPNGVPYGNIQATVSALSTWIRQPEALKSEGHRFFRFHKRDGSTEVIGQQYAELYRRTAAVLGGGSTALGRDPQLVGSNHG